MTVHTRTAPSHASAGAAPATPDGIPSAPTSSVRRLGRITAASLGFGAVTALAVPAVVLSGSSEHVVTGIALLGLALGWGLLAVLSTRLTTQPQRWAVVPAITMAARVPSRDSCSSVIGPGNFSATGPASTGIRAG